MVARTASLGLRSAFLERKNAMAAFGASRILGGGISIVGQPIEAGSSGKQRLLNGSLNLENCHGRSEIGFDEMDRGFVEPLVLQRLRGFRGERRVTNQDHVE